MKRRLCVMLDVEYDINLVCAGARRSSSHFPGLSSINRMEGCVTIYKKEVSAGKVPGSKMKKEIIE